MTAGTMAMSGMYLSPALRSSHQFLSIDGANEVVICKFSSPCILAKFAVTLAMITAEARPKSAKTSRMVAFMYGELRSCTAPKPICNVITPKIKLNKAASVVYESLVKYSMRFFIPSKMKIAHTKRLKMSWVNFVHFLATHAQASEHARMSMKIAVQTPTQPNVGKNSIFHVLQRLKSSMRNTVCGPAGRSTISG